MVDKRYGSEDITTISSEADLIMIEYQNTFVKIQRLGNMIVFIQKNSHADKIGVKIEI